MRSVTRQTFFITISLSAIHFSHTLLMKHSSISMLACYFSAISNENLCRFSRKRNLG